MVNDKLSKGDSLGGKISWWGVAAAAIGLVVASTTFAGDFNGYGIAGPAYIIALIFGFALNFCVMVAYAELTTMFPKSGQVYEFTKKGFIKNNRTLALLLATGIGTTYWAMFGLTFASEMAAGAHAVVSTTGIGNVTMWILLINVSGVGINLLGLKPTVIAETILVILMVGIRMFLGIGSIIGTSNLGVPNFSVFANFIPHGIAGIFAAGTLGVYAFIGLELATPLVEEVKKPEKNIPKGMSVGVTVVLMMALTMGIGIMTVFDPVTNQGTYTGNAPQIEIAGILFGTNGRLLAGVASLAATTGSVIVSYAAIPRIIYAMAREGLWPEQFTWLHPRFETPWVAIFATTIVFLLPTLFSNQVVSLIDAATAVWLLVYIWVLGLAIKLRYTHPQVERPFSVHQSVYIIGGLLICLVLWQSYKGSYELIALALGIFALCFTFAGSWIRFGAAKTAIEAVEVSDD